MLSSIRLNDFQRKLIHIISIIMVLIIAIGVRINYINQKEGLHIDEVMSIMISRYSPQWHAPWISGSGSDVKERCFWNDASLTQAVSDIKKLHADNRDRPHTNLYYSLLRLCFVGVSSFDLKQTIWRGCLLNIILFLISFLFFFKMLQLLFKDDWLPQTICMLFAFCNVGAISNSLLLRTYQLQETCLITFTYFVVKILYNGINNNRLILLSIVTALTLLSGYFAATYVLMSYGILLLYHGKNSVKIIIFAFIFSLFLSQLLYTNFFCGFSCGRAGEGYRALFSIEIFNNIWNAICNTYRLLNEYLFSYHIVIIAFFLTMIIVPFLIFRHIIVLNKNIIITLGIVSISLVWSIGNMFLANWKDLRYISAVFPLIALISMCFIVSIRRWRKIQLCSCCIILMLVLCGFKTKIPYLYKELSTLKTLLGQYKNKPVYCVDNDICVLCNLIQYCNDEQIYHKVNQLTDIPKLSSILIFTNKKYDDMKMLWHSDKEGCYLHEK